MLYEVVNAGTITQEAKNRPIWNRCYDFKKIFAKNIGGKWRFLLKLLLVFEKNIIPLVLEKNHPKNQKIP
jgi:hypothetical protein